MGIVLDMLDAMHSAGYSKTPLARKLGIKEASCVLLLSAPEYFVPLLAPLPQRVAFAKHAGANVDVAHLFVTRREQLAARLSTLRKKLRSDAVLWVSWPKKSSGISTTISDLVIREIALPLGFVDIKVCAVDEVWSGLKLMVRRELRGRSSG